MKKALGIIFKVMFCIMLFGAAKSALLFADIPLTRLFKNGAIGREPYACLYGLLAVFIYAGPLYAIGDLFAQSKERTKANTKNIFMLLIIVFILMISLTPFLWSQASGSVSLPAATSPRQPQSDKAPQPDRRDDGFADFDSFAATFQFGDQYAETLCRQFADGLTSRLSAAGFTLAEADKNFVLEEMRRIFLPRVKTFNESVKNNKSAILREFGMTEAQFIAHVNSLSKQKDYDGIRKTGERIGPVVFAAWTQEDDFQNEMVKLMENLQNRIKQR